MNELKIILYVIAAMVAFKLFERFFERQKAPNIQKPIENVEGEVVEEAATPSNFEVLIHWIKCLRIPAWLKVLAPFWVLFLVFYLLSDWTSYTIGQISPISLVFNNTLNQLWIASARFVFIIAFVFSLVLFSSAFPQWNDLRAVLEGLKEKYATLSTWEKLKLFYFCFFGLMYLFIQLLQVRLPEELKSVLP